MLLGWHTFLLMRFHLSKSPKFLSKTTQKESRATVCRGFGILWGEYLCDPALTNAPSMRTCYHSVMDEWYY